MTTNASDLSAGFYMNDIQIIPERNLLSGPSRSIRVEPKVMAVLVRLAQSAGSVVSHDQLIASVWGPDGATSDLTSRAVGHLRRVLSHDGAHGVTIETIRGRGYCLVAHIQSERQSVVPPTGRSKLRSRWLSPVLASALSFAASAAWWVFMCVLAPNG